MAKLILRGEEGAEREFPLDDGGSLTIGRSPECNIPIDDVQASRKHCSVVRIQSGYELADLGSTNGTLVNSALVKRKKLRHGDLIRIGSTEIVFHDPGAAGDAGAEIENCFLVHARGEHKGERVELTQQRTTIGRKETNSIVLKDANASSYHCEIVRDLNGYTIRDLGSTNGTLVNNETITEAQLVHGARIRIGSTRFVFQDPAMAEIDLELAGVEDEEADWGMMRELDLQAVRRRHPATYVYLGLTVLLLGGLGYLFTLEPREGPTGPVAPEDSLLRDYSFELASSAYAWDSEVPGEVMVTVTDAVHGEGTSALEIRSNVADVEVFYSESPSAMGKRFRFEGKVGVRGGARARLGILWTGLGLTRWEWSEAAASPGLTPLAAEGTAPPWARHARLGIGIAGGGTAFLDDIVLRQVEPPEVTVLEQNNFALTITDGTDIVLEHAKWPVLALGRLVARDASGAEIAAPDLRASVTALDGEHMAFTIRGGSGAALVGLEMQEVRDYLAAAGFRAFGFTDDSGETTYFISSFPEEGAVVLEHVRKILLGSAGRAFAALPAEDEGRLQCEVRVDGDRRFWAVFGTPGDGGLTVRIKTDLRGETSEANRRMNQALLLHKEGRWGEFLAEAQRTLAEFPFASKGMQRELNRLIDEVNQEYTALDREAEEMVRDYREFRDLASLDRVREILGLWRDRYQIEAGTGPRGERFAELSQMEQTERADAQRARQSALAGAVLEQALYINIPEGEVYSAAVLLSYIDKYLPASAEAAQAREELTKIQEQHPEVLEVLTKLGLRGD